MLFFLLLNRNRFSWHKLIFPTNQSKRASDNNQSKFVWCHIRVPYSHLNTAIDQWQCASEGYKLKAECLFLICLELLFSLYCNFWHIFRSSDKVAWGPLTRTETKGERKRTTTTKQNASNSLCLVEEVTPQILSLGTKTICYVYGCVTWSKCVFLKK